MADQMTLAQFLELYPEHGPDAGTGPRSRSAFRDVPRDPAGPEEMASEILKTVCGATGCNHQQVSHTTTPSGDSVCIACYNQYPNDDSLVENGIYHAFIS